MKRNYFKEKELLELEKFCTQVLFPGLPEVPVYYDSKSSMGGAMGVFCMSKNRDYNDWEDEFMDDPGYRSKYKRIKDTDIGIELNNELSWTHPLNHPDICIRISKDIADKPLEVIGTLMHELMHYYCWYCGFEYSDDSREFNDRLKNMGIPTNEDIVWSDRDACWKDAFDYSSLQLFLDRYLRSVNKTTPKSA